MDAEAKQVGWEAWVRIHAGKLLLYARQQARCEADAQDFVQEAVVESWRRKPGAGPPPLPMVFATIRRRAIDLARSADRRVRRERWVAEEQSVEWFDTSLEDREMSGMMQSALSQLPAGQREAVTLRIWGGLTFSEVAATVGVPVNTAASRYRYGLAALRELTKEVLA